MPRFRCYHCNVPAGMEFIADGPSCPSCKRTGGQLIFPLVDVHWLEERPDGPLAGYNGTKLAIGCMPKRPNTVGLSGTPLLTEVSCPACRKSEAFQVAWAEWAATWPDRAREWEAKQTLQV